MEQKELKNKVKEIGNHFLTFKNESMAEDERMQKMALLSTQSFYEGEAKAIQKRRNLGIIEQYHFVNDDAGSKKSSSAMIDTYSNDSVSVGQYQRPMKIKRIFYKNQKEIGTVQEKRNVRMIMYQPATRENQVACPNCGAYAPIETYVDGCDYCHSKFQVSDFELKISGLSTYFNLTRLNELPFAILVIFLMIGYSKAKVLGGKYQLWGTILVLAIYILATLICGILFAISRKIHKHYINEEILYQIMEKQRVVEIAQDIEQRIKYMSLAENRQEANAFTECNMDTFIAEHSNVIDLDVEQLHFQKAEVSNDGKLVIIDLIANTQNFYYEDGKIKKHREELALEVVEDMNLFQSKARPIKKHSCSHCGNTINIFNGGICEYCHTPQNRYDIGWVIRRFSWKSRSEAKFVTCVVLSYAVCILLMFISSIFII